MALLGWNPGTEQELFTLKELIGSFTLERVNKSGARFDPEKNNWYNQQWLQLKSNEQLAEIYAVELQKKGVSAESGYIVQVVSSIKERANFVKDFWELSDYFFQSPTSYNEKAVKKQWKEDTPEIMQQVAEVLEDIKEFESSKIEETVKAWITEKELSFGKVMPPLRLVIVGDMKGPHLFDIMALIGKAESIGRIKAAIDRL